MQMKANRIVQFLLVSVLVFGAFGFATPLAASPANTHPLLLELATRPATGITAIFITHPSD